MSLKNYIKIRFNINKIIQVIEFKKIKVKTCKCIVAKKGCKCYIATTV